MSDNATLEERVRQFNRMELPGQPIGWHMGTGYLVNDLVARIAELEADYARAEDITKRAHAVAAKAMERIAELEAERDKLAEQARSWKGAAHEYEEQVRFAQAERDRLISIGEAYAYRSEDHGPGKKS